ncbi:MAG: EutN/CcmL family microcompartment protein [Planctomycetota bacterium]|nr:EutN/CcmL family microcompartment protein [Planctomycetota bacterium]
MLQATVIGRAISTLKHESMVGQKMLIVQPRMKDGSPEGDPLIAIDGVGAGVGENVIITSDGRNARSILNAEATPVRWSIIGIKDEKQ